MLDEIDALVGDTLLAVLRQLRAGYLERLRQTRAYMDRCGTAEGHLVIFDRTAGASWDDKVYRRENAAGGPTVTVWGM